jgi:hypothetical protein
MSQDSFTVPDFMKEEALEATMRLARDMGVDLTVQHNLDFIKQVAKNTATQHACIVWQDKIHHEMMGFDVGE